MLSIQLIGRKTDQNKSVAQMAEEEPPPGWIEIFRQAKSELQLVSTHLNNLGLFFPHKKDMFRAFDLCPLVDVKVVIIGQDPYPSVYNGYPQANGLCFSTNRDCPLQDSLINIYKELKHEYSGFVPPNHGDLSNWANQGVLLLNKCLTVKPHEKTSHKQIWNGFLTRVLSAISKVNSECIYLLWGKPAQDVATQLGERTIKLMASHPSPLSANRATKDAPAFIGCDHFRKVNEYLVKQGKEPINWTQLY